MSKRPKRLNKKHKSGKRDVVSKLYKEHINNLECEALKIKPKILLVGTPTSKQNLYYTEFLKTYCRDKVIVSEHVPEDKIFGYSADLTIWDDIEVD